MPRMSKFFRLLINWLCLLLVSYFITRQTLNPVLKKKLIRYIPDIKYLLLWSKVDGLHENGQKQFVKKKCFNLNCYFTMNKNFLGDIRYFDGIIFNLQDVSKGPHYLPKRRGYNQKYIFAANDSADNYPVCDPVYENFFNWTWTYKTDSTIPYRFISVYNQDQQELSSHFKWRKFGANEDDVMKKDLNSKSKAAAIFLEQCPTRSGREMFVGALLMALKKYNLTIDIFGKCGTQQCRKKTMKPCLWKLRKFYFFYLAMEDSFAEDYLTKNVLYAYENNAVPIVYGSADYHRFLPPNSYIDGRGLGPEKLAEVMYQTITNPSRYRQLFKWKPYYTIKSSEVLDICALCSAFNNPTWLSYSTTYSEFRKWWNPYYEKRCEEDKKSFFSYFG